MTAAIHIQASEFGPAVSTTAPPGERLLDVCDATAAPVPFSCRDATCGTCLVEITQGAELFDRVGVHEWVVLDALGRPPRGGGETSRAPREQPAEQAVSPSTAVPQATQLAPRYRLACQASVAGEGVIRLRLAAPRGIDSV